MDENGDRQEMQHCLNLIADEDRTLYSSLLFLSEHHRASAAALHAFHLEVSRIPFLVSEPTPGEIRLQWWREAIDGERPGEATANPLSNALNAVIGDHDLPGEGFDRYLEARIFDLYQDPMPDRTTLEAYFGETDSFILQMVALSMGAEQSTELADACGHAGVAIGIVNCLTRLPLDRRRQRVYIPADLLQAAGLTTGEWLSADGSQDRHKAATDMLIAIAREHVAKASAAIAKMPREVQPAFLPLAIARAKLRKAVGDEQILLNGLAISPLRAQWSLWKAALFGI